MSYRQPAAKRGEGVCPRLNWRCADEFVKEPAVLAQLRIRRRHPAGNLFSSIENNLNPQRAQTQATARPLGPLASRPRTARKSALESRGCSHFCPTVAVDTAELHDKIRKAQKMHKFNKFGVFSPPQQAWWYSRGAHRSVPAEHTQESEPERHAGRSTRSRGGLVPIWTVLVCSNCPDSVQQAYLRAAISSPTPRRESGLKRYGSIAPDFFRGMAWALQCSPPCESAIRRRSWGRRRRNERV
jgi:hypothetical protein